LLFRAVAFCFLPVRRHGHALTGGQSVSRCQASRRPSQASRDSSAEIHIGPVCLGNVMPTGCGGSCWPWPRPTAGHQAPADGGTRYVFASPGLASRPLRRHSSSVSQYEQPSCPFDMTSWRNCSGAAREQRVPQGSGNPQRAIGGLTVVTLSYVGHKWMLLYFDISKWQFDFWQERELTRGRQ